MLHTAEEFEQERSQLLEAVERCAVHQEEVHRLEWENRKRVDEIQELQQVRRGQSQQQSHRQPSTSRSNMTFRVAALPCCHG
jgi:hypothetical protein